jgi:hypothetical protein
MTNKELKTLRKSQFKGISFRLGRILRFARPVSKGWFGGSSSGITGLCGKKKGIGFELTQKLYKG